MVHRLSSLVIQASPRQHCGKGWWCGSGGSADALILCVFCSSEGLDVVGRAFCEEREEQQPTAATALVHRLRRGIVPLIHWGDTLHCHSCSHFGWWYPVPPPATPRLGGAAVSCQYFPCSYVPALREPGLFDRGPNPPSRSALAPVGSSPGPVLSPVTVLSNPQFASLKPWLQTRDRDIVLPRGGV
jgi:hypothetical protein